MTKASTEELTYRELPDWEQLPAGRQHLDVSDVAVDADDRVYVLTRYDLGVLVYERDGTFVKSWTSDCVRQGNHGIAVGPDGSVYVVDWKEHFVAKHTNDGEVVQVLGTPGRGSDTGIDPALLDGNYFDTLAAVQRRGLPFHGPTSLAFAPDGTFFVADGYCNAAIHHFTAEGELIASWGAPGSEPGQFRNPHAIDVTPDGRVVVADRENCRVQIFDAEGGLLDIVADLRRPAAAAVAPDGCLCVAESEVQPGHHRPFLGHFDTFVESRLSVFGPDGELLFRADVPTGPEAVVGPNSVKAKLAGPNGIAVDSRGDIYLAEVTFSMYDYRTPGGIGTGHQALHKFERKGA